MPQNRFTIVGLPGAGKSTVMTALGKKLGMPVKETDADMLRPVRKDPNHPVMQDYAATFQQTYGQPLDISLLPKTAEFMDRYGIPAFRDFEEKLFVWSMNNGVFNGCLPDLGGSIFLREGSRNALKAQNISSIYLDVPEDAIVPRLMQDFEEGLRTPSTVKRANYHTPALNALNDGQNPEDVLRIFSQQHRRERDQTYRLADHIVVVAPNETVDMIANKVLATISAPVLPPLRPQNLAP